MFSWLLAVGFIRLVKWCERIPGVMHRAGTENDFYLFIVLQAVFCIVFCITMTVKVQVIGQQLKTLIQLD